MKQSGLFEREERKKKLLATRDFLHRINSFVDWEIFRKTLEKGLGRSKEKTAGRPPYDCILMFKILMLQALYNLSDEEVEYQILDRQSFMDFLGFDLSDKVPDARTIWLFRENLRERGLVEKLFTLFDDMVSAHGFKANGGQIIDATFVEVPRQRNNKEDNAIIKRGETPEQWSDKKKAHKDMDARWTKKNAMTFYGYKNHVGIDRGCKFIRRYKVTDAAVHDSRELDSVIDPSNDGKSIWADSAYRSEEQEARLRRKGFISHIHERAYRNKPLTSEQESANKQRSKVRARIEHVFGHMETSMRGCFVRTIGIARASVKIGLECIAYNVHRFTFLKTRQVLDASA